ncbi:uncharacterized protein [Fopius arisanus]|uniref:Uncharacterized protein isoform X2 n=1 Tax=Fopius arisanus TaxID=64838 RepID=A0A9R1U7H7_9HYME|nr:PREDICTED: uncharacterized protein LOC105271771 isoform X2 [Fopius arisanus]
MTSYGAIFFNPSLFFINERPMKFYLDGYANHEINEIAKIIEAFGGKLSAPDVNTIIFSEPGRPITTEYSRYHIQCLHDSMVARKFQDLEQYRIPVIKEELMDPSDHEASHPAGTCVAVVNPNINLLKPWKIVSVSSYAEMAKEKNTREFIQSMSDWHLHSSITNTASESAVFNNNEGENREFTSYSTKRLTFSSSPRGNSRRITCQLRRDDPLVESTSTWR